MTARARRGLDTSALLGRTPALSVDSIEALNGPAPADAATVQATPRLGRRPSPIDVSALVAAVAAGASMRSAARAAGVAPRTLHRRLAADPALRATVDRARVRLAAAVSSAVARRAIAGSVPAARLVLARYERSRARSSDTDQTLDQVQERWRAAERKRPGNL